MVLAEAIHSTTRHGIVYSFAECPQRRYDEQEAEELRGALALRDVVLVESVETAAAA